MSLSLLLNTATSTFDPTAIGSSSAATTALTGAGSSVSRALQTALTNPTTTTAGSNASNDIVVMGSNDTRIRIIPGNKTSTTAKVLGANDPSSNILSILYETNGLLFPYTPAISVSQSVAWDPLGLVQTNFDINAYQKTSSVTISVSGTFTTQTQREGEYLMAVLHFLRVVTKSDFGNAAATRGTAGLPPPVLYFNGYGDFMFKYLPCVIKGYSYSFDETTDSKIFVSRSGNSARLPAKMTISIELGLQINAQAQRNDFDLEDFRTGKLLKNMGGFF